MAFPPVRVKQSTNTTGTGALALNAASSGLQSWLAGFGSGTSVQVRYTLQRDGVFEVGYGSLNTSTQTLTRDFVTKSSNGGALVSLTAGTTDVFFDFLPGDRQIRTISANTTLDRSDLGVLIRCTQTADITVTLPPVATVPGGTSQLSMGYLIRNAAANNAIVWIATNGSETLDGSASSFPLFPGEEIEVYSLGTVWMSGIKPTGVRLVGRYSASNSTSVDIILPLYPGAQRPTFELRTKYLRTANDGAALFMRMSTDGGATFAAGASDYEHGYGVVSGVSSWAGGSVTSGGIQLSSDLDTGASRSHIFGSVLLVAGASGARNAGVIGTMYTAGNGGSYVGTQPQIVGGVRTAAADVNAIRLIAGTGNILLGDFELLVTY